jgi:outer membrane immunogenic protein
MPNMFPILNRVIRYVVMSAGFFAAGASAALASDLPRAPYLKAQASVPVYDWSGFYVGAQAGAASLSARFNDITSAFHGQGLRPERDLGFTGGGYGGINWQIGALVLGVDAQWSYYRSTAESYPFGEADGSELKARLNNAGGVKGRVGLAFNDTLIYVGAGPSWANATFSTYKTAVVINDHIPPQSDTRTVGGYAVAGGFEHVLFSNWILRSQVQYARYATQSFEPLTVDGVPTPLGQRSSVLEGTLGLAYKFGPSLTP